MSSQKSNLERSSVNGVRGDQMPDYPVGGVSSSNRRSSTSNNQTTATRRCRNCNGRGVCSNCGGTRYYRPNPYSHAVAKCGCGNGKCRTCGGTGTR
ncbi:MAG: hypothetical protein ACI3X6_06890 [Alloprevotella sp.]